MSTAAQRAPTDPDATQPRVEEAYADALDRRRLAVVSAQASGIRPQIVALTMVIAAIAWSQVPHAVVASWFIAVLAMRELRVRQLQRWATDASVPVARHMSRFLWSSAVFGAISGAAGLFMLWLDRERDALLTMVMMSWAAGAVSTTAPLLRGYLVFCAGIYAPVAVMWLLDATPLSASIAGLVLMFAGVQAAFARQNAVVFEQSFQIRRENENLVRQLGAARDRAEAADRAKTRFLAVASHDLRQPLHALTLHTGLLALDPHAPDAPAIVREISASIDSLAKLLDSLLDISKLDAGVMPVNRRRIVLARLLAHLVRMNEAQARHKGLALRWSCPPDAVVDTDPLLLERLLRNLIDNALKYTDRGEVALVAEGGERLVVAVRDTGRGIPADAQRKVFDEFYQVAPDGRGAGDAQGLGLGLAIVQRLATLLELPLTLQSEPGVGTAISLTMAAAAAPVEETAEAGADAGARLEGLRVLLVDDEAAVRSATRRVLDHFGCITAEAAGTDDAVEQAERLGPELVVADYRLRNGETGVAVVERLRQSQPALPALLVTGDTVAERLREAEASGLPLLHKPVAPAQLRDAMRAVLASH